MKVIKAVLAVAIPAVTFSGCDTSTAPTHKEAPALVTIPNRVRKPAQRVEAVKKQNDEDENDDDADEEGDENEEESEEENQEEIEEVNETTIREAIKQARVKIEKYAENTCKAVGTECSVEPTKELGTAVVKQLTTLASSESEKEIVSNFLKLCKSVGAKQEKLLKAFLPELHRLNQCMEIFVALAAHKLEKDHKASLIAQVEFLLSEAPTKSSASIYNQLNDMFTRTGKKITEKSVAVFNILRLAELLSLKLEKNTANALGRLAKDLITEFEKKTDGVYLEEVASILAQVRTQIYLGTKSSGSDDTRKATKAQLEKLNELSAQDPENVNREAEDGQEGDDDNDDDDDDGDDYDYDDDDDDDDDDDKRPEGKGKTKK